MSPRFPFITNYTVVFFSPFSLHTFAFKPDFSLHTGKTFDTLPPPPPKKRMTVMGILKLFRPPILKTKAKYF